ncbi:hypothetical protein pb186bvf_018987 [Paramecium bursaria]
MQSRFVQSYVKQNDLQQFKLTKKYDLPGNSLIESIIKFDNKIIYIARNGDIRKFYYQDNTSWVEMKIAFKRDIILLVCNVQDQMRSQEYLIVVQKEEKNNEVHLDILHMENEQIQSDTMQFQTSSKIVTAFQLKNWVVIIEQNSVIHLAHLQDYYILQFDELKSKQDILRDAFIKDDQSIILFYDQRFSIIEFDTNNKLINLDNQKIYIQYRQVFNFLGGVILLDIDGEVHIMNYIQPIFRKSGQQLIDIMRINNFQNNISKFAFFQDKKNMVQTKNQSNPMNLGSTGVDSNKSASQLQGQVSVCEIQNYQIQRLFQISNEQKCDFIYQADDQTFYIGSNNTIYTLEKQVLKQESTQIELIDRSIIVPAKKPQQIEKLENYPEIKLIKELQVPKNLFEFLTENDKLSMSQNSNQNYQQSYYEENQQQYQQEQLSQIGSQIQNIQLESIKYSNNIIYLQYMSYIFVCDDYCNINQTVKVQDMISYIPHMNYLYVASLFNNEDFKVRIYGIEKEDFISLKPSIKYQLKGKPNLNDGILKKYNNIITIATNNGFMTKVVNEKLEEIMIAQNSIEQVLLINDKIITVSNDRFIQSYTLKKEPQQKVEIQGIMQVEIYDDQHLLVCQRENIFSLILLSTDDFKIKKTINYKDEIEKLYCNKKFIYIISNYQLSVLAFDEKTPKSKVYRHQYEIQLQQINYFTWEDRRLLTSDAFSDIFIQQYFNYQLLIVTFFYSILNNIDRTCQLFLLCSKLR